MVLLLGNWIYVFGTTMGAENSYLNAGSVAFWRGLAICILNTLIIKFRNKKIDFRDKHDFSLLNARSFYASLHGIIISLSLYYLPSPIVHTINSCGPLIVFVLDYIRNGTAVTNKQIVGIFISAIGLLITINAALILSWIGWSDTIISNFNYVESSLKTKTVVSLIFVLSQIGSAYALILTKEIKTQDPYQIGLHFGIVQTVTGAMTGLTFGFSHISIAQQLWVVLLVSIPLGIANIFMTVAFTMTKHTGRLSMVMFNCVIVGYLISVIRYD